MHFLLIAVAIFFLAGCDSAPRVTVDGETLAGTYLESGAVAAFLGVPFAEPPVGELRWRAPQPMATRVGERDATRFAPACMQSMRILDWYRSLAVRFGGSEDYYDELEISEDCLYLNIWTPTLQTDARLPVMVWVHGGSNKSGWSYEPNYHGHVLAPQGAVVISVAYRLGVFGFLSHPELAGDDALANFALWDLIASLRWIQDNVAKFGGDPDRVMLFGESSGAQNILALMFAESATGLFHRAALQSTAGYGLERMSTLADEQQRGVALASKLGIDEPNALARLRKVSADQVLSTYEAMTGNYYHAPAIDGQLLTVNTWESILAGDFGGRELIIGTNRDEWLDYIATDSNRADLARLASELQHLDGDRALEVVAAEQGPRRAMDRLTTADRYVCASQQTAASVSAGGGDAFVYYFTRVRDHAAGRALGAYHGAEYPYIFGVHDAYMPTTGVDIELTRIMAGYWLNFAASGDPNGAGLPPWPRFVAPYFAMQELGDEVQSIAAIEPALCALFRR